MERGYRMKSRTQGPSRRNRELFWLASICAAIVLVIMAPRPDPSTLTLCELGNPHPRLGRAAAFVGDTTEFLTNKQIEVELA